MKQPAVFEEKVIRGRDNGEYHITELREELIAPLAEYFTRNKEYHTPWFPRSVDMHTLEGQTRRFAAYTKKRERESEFRFLLLHGEKVIGAISHTSIERGVFQNGRYGYSMDEQYTGKNILTQGLQYVMDFSFNTLLLHRVEANIMPSNIGSQRILEKCGFERIGFSPRYVCINGKWEDHLLYARLNPDEEKSQPHF